ncbi:MAG: hypothetical protein ACYS8W_04795 [Planctomycetota bacterium]
MKRKILASAFLVAGLFVACALVIPCGCSKKKDKLFWFPLQPEIENINSVSDPATIVGVSIEINGVNFGEFAGVVKFEQGTNFIEVVPDDSGWTDTSIIVTVPGSGSENEFDIPGTLLVSVITAGGISNAVELDLVEIPTFNPNNLVWEQAASLPEAKTGLKAAVIKCDENSAFIYVSGGQTDAADINEVLYLTNTVDNDSFTAGNSWDFATPLPAPRAFHAMVSAEAANSPVPPGAAFLYVIGGQENASDAPGGTANVFYAPVNPDGSLGNWAETSPLPDARIGHTAAVAKGNIYVVGGLDVDGNATDRVFFAPINPDGSLGAFSLATSSLREAVGFHASFTFGSKLYVLGGLNSSSTDPNDYSIGGATHDVNFAPLLAFDVGAFTNTTQLNKARKKHIVMNAFGQVMFGEGVFPGGPTVTELWVTFIQENGTFDVWNALTNLNSPNASVFNCAAAVSPIYPEGGGPRFFIIGGMDKTGVRRSEVYVNNAP